jgi:hypothetical protein
MSLALVLAAGCGGAGTAQVSGKVTAKGKPLVWGTVTLVDSNGAYHQGVISLIGNYTIDNVPIGGVKIGVVSDNPVGRGGTDGRGAGGDKPGGRAGDVADPRAGRGFRQDTSGEPPRPPPGAWFPINAKYADPSTSELTGEVKPGKVSELNIELK